MILNNERQIRHSDQHLVNMDIQSTKISDLSNPIHAISRIKIFNKSYYFKYTKNEQP